MPREPFGGFTLLLFAIRDWPCWIGFEKGRPVTRVGEIDAVGLRAHGEDASIGPISTCIDLEAL